MRAQAAGPYLLPLLCHSCHPSAACRPAADGAANALCPSCEQLAEPFRMMVEACLLRIVLSPGAS